MDPENYTEAYENVSNWQIAHTPPGMAHWGGTGPAGKTCRECEHWIFSERYAEHPKDHMPFELKPGPCALYAKRSRLPSGKLGPKLKHTQSACKYFEPHERPAPIVQKP